MSHAAPAPAGSEPPACPGFDPHPRTPRIRLPALTCDTHHHVFGPYARYPMQPVRSYTPPEATLEDYVRMCRAVGIERSVLVHPSIYGTELSSLVETLETCRSWMRGVAVIDASFDDAALARLDRAGVRGVRFNVLFKGGTPLAQARVIGERLARAAADRRVGPSVAVRRLEGLSRARGRRPHGPHGRRAWCVGARFPGVAASSARGALLGEVVGRLSDLVGGAPVRGCVTLRARAGRRQPGTTGLGHRLAASVGVDDAQ